MMDIFEIQSHIEELEKDPLLYEEKGFDQRMEVSDFIEFDIIGQIEVLLQKTAKPHELLLLKERAEKMKTQLEEIDINLFEKLQANIRTGEYIEKGFKDLVSEYVDFNLDDGEHQEEPDYDNLDIFINGLSSFHTMPEPIKDLEQDMVFYQKTPARIIFELADRAHFTKDDVFFDLGSGLGQVAILVNLLTGIRTIGIEFEPVFCNYARDCAAALNLSCVEFINIDARKADYSEGTAFFMFTPFRGEMLQEVLEILRKESLLRQIKIITYGPCTEQVALQTWLDCVTPEAGGIYRLCIFISR